MKKKEENKLIVNYISLFIVIVVGSTLIFNIISMNVVPRVGFAYDINCDPCLDPNCQNPFPDGNPDCCYPDPCNPDCPGSYDACACFGDLEHCPPLKLCRNGKCISSDMPCLEEVCNLCNQGCTYAECEFFDTITDQGDRKYIDENGDPYDAVDAGGNTYTYNSEGTSDSEDNYYDQEHNKASGTIYLGTCVSRNLDGYGNDGSMDMCTLGKGCNPIEILDGNGAGTHKKCSYDNGWYCVTVNEPGVDECQSDAECYEKKTHNVCKGSGTETRCVSGEPCPSEDDCFDECSTDFGIGGCVHRECSQDGSIWKCVVVQGADYDECQSDAECCVPQCAGRKCGPDGCGGSCGTCPPGYECNAETGQCCGCGTDATKFPSESAAISAGYTEIVGAPTCIT